MLGVSVAPGPPVSSPPPPNMPSYSGKPVLQGASTRLSHTVYYVGKCKGRFNITMNNQSILTFPDRAGHSAKK